jgi:hypothetical protein
MRAISFSSWARAARSRFPSSTTGNGSMNRVAPLAETSWTRPGIFPRCSAFTGITKRSPRRVIRGSCRYGA